jgi:hypothetical protein
MKYIKSILTVIFASLAIQYSLGQSDNYSSQFNVLNYGAKGDSSTNCTLAIQSAIDACSESGGGTVIVPSGVYLTGMIILKDNVCLNLETGSELRAIPDLKYFPATEPGIPSNFNPFFRWSMIYAENAKNICIKGQGTINGQGQADAFERISPKRPERYQNRPSILRIVNCKGVQVEGVKLINSAFWTFHLMGSKDIVVHGISIYTRTANYNNDGIDIDGCEDVRVSDCYITSADDAISIKATGDRSVRNVLIDNCLLTSNTNGVRVGAENYAGFEDIKFSNCHIFKSGNGIAFQNIDGYPMERIAFRDVSMHEVAMPIYIVTGNYSYPTGIPEDEKPVPHKDTPAPIKDVVFDNITGTRIGYFRGIGVDHAERERSYRSSVIVSGHPKAPLKRISFSNIRLQYTGGGTRSDSKVRLPDVNEHPNPRYEATPVYGIMARYTSGLRLSNVDLTYEDTDVRGAVSIENSTNAILNNVNVKSENLLPVIRYYNSPRLRVNNCTEIIEDKEIQEISSENGNLKAQELSWFKAN